MRLAGALLVLVCVGCTLDRSGLAAPTPPGLDAGARDAGPTGVDAGPRPDAGPGGADAGPRRDDAGPPPFDAGAPLTPDAGPASTPDAGGSSGPDAGARPSCDDLYRPLSGYRLCRENPTSCRFYRGDLSALSCRAACASRGGLCFGAQDNVFGRACEASDTVGCDDGLLDGICTCSR